MNEKLLRTRLRVRLALRVLALIAATGLGGLPWSDSRAQNAPAINFRAVSNGGSTQHNSCFRLSGTSGQAAPGYSSAGGTSLIAGFLAAAPTTGMDEIFFTGFEDC